MWGQSEQDYQQIQSQDRHHEGSFSHEVLAGAGSFAAFKVFEDSQRRSGQPVSHEFAKELLAGFAGAEVDKLVETKGLNWLDTERAKHEAKKRTEAMYDQQYGDQDQYDPYSRGPAENLKNQFGDRW